MAVEEGYQPKHVVEELSRFDVAGRLPTLIAPSLLACDFTKVGKELERMEQAGADWVHLDVMDGHFVPSISFGFPVIKSISKAYPHLYLDCHCMISNPLQYVKSVAESGAHNMTFHLEATEKPDGVIDSILNEGMKCGIVISPDTPVEDLYPVLDRRLSDIYLVLIMSVRPGFGGQKFMPVSVDKCKALHERYPNLNIEIDGGVKAATIGQLVGSGVNIVVSGSGVYYAEDSAEAILFLRNTLDNRINE